MSCPVETANNSVLELMGYDPAHFMARPGTVLSWWGKRDNPQFSNKDVVPRFPTDNMSKDFQATLRGLSKGLGKLTTGHEPTGGGLGLLALSDLHLGQRTERGVDAQVRDAMDLGVTLIEDMLTWPLDRIAILLNGDILDFDNYNGTTTKGTALENTGAAYKEMFRSSVAGIVGLTNWAASHKPVDLFIVEGNHDGNAAFHLGEVLRTTYPEELPQVEVHGGSDTFYYHKFGCNLLTFHHGHSVRDIRKLQRLTSTDAPVYWGSTTHRYYYTGHVHTGHKVEGHTGLMALVGRGDYAKREGYPITMQGGEGQVFDRKLGRIGGTERSW